MTRRHTLRPARLLRHLFSLRRRAAAVLAAVLTAGALVVAVPAGSASARAVEDTFAISMSGAFGNAWYTPDDSWISVTQSNQTGQQVLSVAVTSQSSGLPLTTLTFQSRKNSGQYLDVGYYGDAQRYQFTDPGRPGISVGQVGFCNDQSGDFEVRDIRRSGLSITAVWITFQRYCDGQSPEFGELRLGYPTDPTEVSPEVVRWPSGTYPGLDSYDVPVRVRSTTATPADVTGVSVVGPDAADFAVRSDDCGGTLTSDGCDITVGFTPGGPGPRTAQLKVATSQGDVTTSLDGSGALGTSQWALAIDHEDPTRPDEQLDLPYAVAKGSPYTIQAQAAEPDGTFWNADLSLPTGQTFTTGTYTWAADGTGLRIQLARGNAGCEVDNASITVTDIAFTGPDQDLSRLTMDMDVHCHASYSDTVTGTFAFHASDDVTPPAAPTAFTVTRSGDQATAAWQNPGDSDLAGVLVRWYSGTVPPGATDAGEEVYSGTGSSAAFTAPGTLPVAATVWAYDSHGNVSAPATVLVAPAS